MKLALVIAAALATVAMPAQAAIFVYSGVLKGSNEVPANASTATGTFLATLDDTARSLSLAITFSGLSAPASAGHIHCCAAAGSNAGVVVGFGGFPAATSGSYSRLFTGLSAGTVAGIKNGVAYINIHNARFPGGEIRGQIANAVPETATWGMMIAGFGMVGGAMRLQRRKVAIA